MGYKMSEGPRNLRGASSEAFLRRVEVDGEHSEHNCPFTGLCITQHTIKPSTGQFRRDGFTWRKCFLLNRVSLHVSPNLIN